MFKLAFETDNAAFTDGNGIYEVASILAIVRKTVLAPHDSGHDSGEVRDSNGNRIGQWSLELPEVGAVTDD